MKGFFLNILALTLFLSIFILPVFVLAQQQGGGQQGGQQGGGQPSGGGQLPNPIQAESFTEVMRRVANIAAMIGLPIVVIMIIYSGFLFVWARGSEEGLKKAKTTLWWTVIGALLVVGAYAIATAIANFARQL